MSTDCSAQDLDNAWKLLADLFDEVQTQESTLADGVKTGHCRKREPGITSDPDYLR
jgi:hypothetical protein